MFNNRSKTKTSASVDVKKKKGFFNRKKEETSITASVEEKSSRKGIGSVKVSDVITIVGGSAAAVGSVIGTVNLIRSSTAKPQETSEEIAARKTLQWLMDTPNLKATDSVYEIAMDSPYLKGAFWKQKTIICSMVEEAWPRYYAEHISRK